MTGYFEQIVSDPVAITPSRLLYWIQEISGHHATSLGCGRAVLEEKDLFWAIIRNKLEILRLPKAGEEIRLRTWPMPTTRSAYPRATEGYDRDGNVVFRCVSLWVMMRFSDRAMVLPKHTGVNVPGITLGAELPFPGSLPQIPMENPKSRQVQEEDLDINRHMNNCRYLDWAEDLFPESKKLSQGCRWTVCYLSEARLGDDLTLSFAAEEDGSVRIEGVREEENDAAKQHRIFAAKLEKI